MPAINHKENGSSNRQTGCLSRSWAVAPKATIGFVAEQYFQFPGFPATPDSGTEGWLRVASGSEQI